MQSRMQFASPARYASNTAVAMDLNFVHEAIEQIQAFDAKQWLNFQ